MASLLSRQRSRGSLGLDIDGDFVAAVELSGGRVARAVSADMPAGVIADGEVADGEALAAVLKDFFRSEGLPRKVRLGVANQQIVVRHLELPRIEDEAELAAAVRFQAQEAIPMPLDDVVIDHQVIGGHNAPDGSWRMRVVVVAARRSMVQALVGAARRAGLRPAGIDLDAFALIRALAPEDGDRSEATVYCHLASVANLAVAVGRDCLFSRPLGVALPPAGEGTGAGPLADGIRPSIDSYLTLPEAPPVSRVLLSGPHAGREGLAGELGGLLALPVELAAPLGALEGDAGAAPHRLTVAAGLALGEAA